MSFTFIDWLNENRGDDFEIAAAKALNKLFKTQNIGLHATRIGHGKNKLSDIEIKDKTGRIITNIECKLKWFDQLASPRVSLVNGLLTTSNKNSKDFVEFLNQQDVVKKSIKRFTQIIGYDSTVDMNVDQIKPAIRKLNLQTGKKSNTQFDWVDSKKVYGPSATIVVDVTLDNDKFFKWLTNYYFRRSSNVTDYILFSDVGLMIIGEDVLHLFDKVNTENKPIYFNDLSDFSVCKIQIDAETSNGTKSFKMRAKIANKDFGKKMIIGGIRVEKGNVIGANTTWLESNFPKS